MSKPTDAYASLEDQVVTLRELQRRWVVELKSNPAITPTVSMELRKVGESLVVVSAELRKTEAANRKVAARLSYEEKRELMVEFFGTMPREHQIALHQELTRKMNAA